MTQNGVQWGRVSAEGVAIVISILLAFAINAWWDRRQDRVEEAEILRGLESAFLSFQSEFANRAAGRRDALRLLETVLAAGPPLFQEAPSAAVSDSAVNHMLIFPIIDPSSGTLEALLSSGRLELLENRDLRDQLASWASVVGDIRDNELDSRQFINTVLAPLLASRGVPVARVIAARYAWPVPLVPDEQAATAYRGLFRDPDFSAVASMVYGRTMNNAAEYASASELAGQILTAVRAEQK